MADQHQRLLQNFAQKLESTRQLGLNDFSLKVEEEIHKIGSDGIFTSDEVMMITEEAKEAVQDVFVQVENMSSVFAKSLMDQALQHNITLSVNVDQIEAAQAVPVRSSILFLMDGCFKIQIVNSILIFHESFSLLTTIAIQ